jgi:Ca-activated chloride channel homolog
LARHAAPRNNRGRWYSLATILLIAVVTAVVVIVASPGGSSSSNRTAATSASPSPTPTPTSTCTDHPTLNVVAASGIAEVVRDVASRTCLHATVTATDDSAAAAKMLKQGKADVWVPDSRVRAILAGTALTAAAPSIASSPIVVAAGSSLNTSRFDKTPLTWSNMLHRNTLSPLKVEVQDTATSGTALVLASALNSLALKETGDKYLGLASTAVASETMASATTNAIPAGTLRIEEARLVAQQSGTKVVNISGGYPQLDYPWVASPTATSAVKAASAELLTALQGPAGDAARKQHGLLKAGTAAVQAGTYTGAQAGTLIASPSVASIPVLYSLAEAGAQHGNILGVLDLSGSMADPTSPGGPTKLQAVQNSANIAASLLSPQTQLGLWEFTYQLDPPRDYKPIVPIAPLSTNRSKVLDALNAAQPILTGGTSLYRTVFDAYQYVQANWKAGYANNVLVFTDGKDETDPGAPSLAAIQAQLKSIADPKRPIQLIMLGYGQADIPAMQALVSTVGGSVYHIESPTQIVGAFVDAISHSVLLSLGESTPVGSAT